MCSSSQRELIPTADNPKLINSISDSYAMIGGTKVSNPGEFETRAFAEVHVHPGYWANGGNKNQDFVPAALQYDIALIKLSAPVTNRATIKPNCDAKIVPPSLKYVAAVSGPSSHISVSLPALARSRSERGARVALAQAQASTRLVR